MSHALADFFANPFLFSALLAGLAASIASGVIGCYIVVKRIVFIAGSIAHAVLGGMALCLWLNKVHGITWLSPLHGALGAAILAALIVGWVHLHYKEREDALIAALWAVGMASGVVLFSKTPGYNVDLSSFLVGNILWVSTNDLWMLLGLDALLIAIVLLFHKKFEAICFDSTQARLQGLNVTGLYLLLLVLCAISIVLLIEVVGIVLVMAMLALPPTLAGRISKSLVPMMLWSVTLTITFCWAGTGCAYAIDWPPGASIALLTSLVYATSLFRWGGRRPPQHPPGQRANGPLQTQSSISSSCDARSEYDRKEEE